MKLYTPNRSWDFEFLRRVVVTDIRPDVLKATKKSMIMFKIFKTSFINYTDIG